MKAYWDCLALRFQHQQSPLRPCAEDTSLVQRIIQKQNRKYPRLNNQALLLGVTPELAGLAWPKGTFLTAIEKSQPMIDRIWPGDVAHQRQAVCGNWFDVKFKKHSFDFIVGDGFLTALSYPEEYGRMAGRMLQWLKPGGLLIARLFVRPPKKETFAQILKDLEANKIARFDILKWRLGMALQTTVQSGVVLNDIYRAWNKIARQHPGLLKKTGWPRLTVDTIKLYAGRTNRYAFPTLKELKAIFPSELKPVSVTVPAYDFGRCCPMLVYRHCPAKKDC